MLEARFPRRSESATIVGKKEVILDSNETGMDAGM